MALIGYPTKAKKTTQKKTVMYNNRGMRLEEELNTANEYYRASNIAVIHKKPTPIQIVKVDYPKRSAAKITEAYFRTPSTTDYNGIYKGRYIDFEAKQTNNKTALPLQNFYEHQIEHMQAVLLAGGICFIIIHFTQHNETFLIDAQHVIEIWQQSKSDGRKSISYQFSQMHGHKIDTTTFPTLNYIDIIDKFYLGGE
ncbi:Holliday junction resolvase RecU [Culicoidibacter larvae]|uniref:Holliday junction resolvase RecU n=1 Tax=Culicoidibacter larvae TaxID=2579976 RepID=A0A5R8QF07_9FIRM|nr:Holliday junction resolvase RecU [Culicoidibacter larvae]TLG76595.1 Holliday junction resolvase RecU [Culicoidibacter larvae]